MIPVLLSLVVLHPFLAEPSDLRLVAAGTGAEVVDWTVDGQWVATTRDREAATLLVEAGPHRVTAESRSPLSWTAVVRPAPDAAGMAYVSAWSAASPGETHRPIPGGDWGVVALLAGAALVRGQSHSKPS